MIKITFFNRKGEEHTFEKQRIFLIDRVNILEHLEQMEDVQEENTKLERELSDSIIEAGEQVNENEEVDIEKISKQFENTKKINRSLQKAQLKMIDIYAELMVKLFDEQFTEEEFLNGMDADFQMICDGIITEALGGKSDDEKK